MPQDHVEGKATRNAKAKNLPWYKRCPADWQRGTRKHAMSMELRGFYSECLDAMWELQDQLPKDPKVLAMMLGTNARLVRSLMPMLIATGKLQETPIGYYNSRMMADILGVEEVEVQARLELQSSSNRAPIELQSSSKVPEKPILTTRETETDTDSKRDARTRGNFWVEQLNPTAAGHGSAERDPDGRIRLLNGTRVAWAEKFGGEDRLDLALATIAPYVEENGQRSLLVRIEAQLARQLADKQDRDQRYTAAAAKAPSRKPYGRSAEDELKSALKPYVRPRIESPEEIDRQIAERTKQLLAGAVRGVTL